MGCVKASTSSKATIAYEYHDIPFLTNMEMQTFTAPSTEVFNCTKKRAKQPRSPLSLPSFLPLHNALKIIHSACQSSARNTNIIPVINKNMCVY
jgi:hypothetical protein